MRMIIPYEIELGECTTTCPNGFNKKVGSVICKVCSFYGTTNAEKKIVYCKFKPVKTEENK